MKEYGLLTLLPAILVIVTAVWSKRTAEPLFLGCIVTYLITDGFHCVPAIVDAFFSVLTDYDNVWLIVVCGLFGSLIALLNASNGTKAIAEKLEKICKSGKSTLLASWILGIIIFVDDYMNIMTISSCMKCLSDKHKLPRESLAYVIDSTGAPTCVLLPFSTWAIFYAGVFYEQEAVQQLGYGSAIATYTHVIPYIFYAIIALLIVPLFAVNALPKLGSMKKAYQRVQETGAVYSPASERYNQEIVESDKSALLIDFAAPMILLMVITTINGDIFLALLAAVAACFVLYVPRKLLGIGEFFDLFIKGFADLMPSLIIIVAALMMRQAQNDIGLPDYVVGHILPYVKAATFPAVVFAVVSVLAFITGSNWGIPAVCAPIIIPLATASGVNLLPVMAAIVGGGTFSSHACFYSDATVLTSSSCGIDNMDHASTQLPYAFLAFGLSLLAYLILGMI